MTVSGISSPVPKQDPINPSDKGLCKDAINCGFVCSNLLKKKVLQLNKNTTTNESISSYQINVIIANFDRDELNKIDKDLETQANQGQTKAQNDHGCVLALGFGVQGKTINQQGKQSNQTRQKKQKKNDPNKRLTCFKEAKCLLEAQYNLGFIWETEFNNPKKACEQYHLAADQDLPEAQNNLGRMYELGLGTAEQDGEEAFRLYHLAADRRAAYQGLPEAQFNLGRMYDLGLGTARNEGRACGLYRRVADQGLPEAQNNLGRMHELGLGTVKQDGEKAFRLYHLSADQGLPEAQFNLGCMYENGCGNVVKRSDVKARYWYHKAAEQGNRMAREVLRAMSAW